MTLGVLVIGLGQIGMGYDQFLDANRHILTHARAFQLHPYFKLLGGVDSDTSRCREFELAYACPSYGDITSALKDFSPDVVAVSVPTQLHADVVKQILDTCKPKAILCEKPLSYEIKEARQIAAICEEQSCRLFVNYIRRSDPGVLEVKRRFQHGQIVSPVKGVVWYSKGLLHNGSHFFNLLQYWLGDVQDIRVIEPGRLWGGIDPEPDLLVSFAHGKIQFLAAQEENFSHYTVELVAQNGRLRYERGGARIVWQAAIKSVACTGYTMLDKDEEMIAADLDRIQWHVVDQLASSLNGHDSSICSGKEALHTLELLTAIKVRL
jgi:predicted dehydrogenase